VHLTQSTLIKFRKEVIKAFGKPVATQRDCELLSRAIEEQLKKRIASHTLRRFFGIVSWQGEFRNTTLDLLAKFTGRQSCESLIHEFTDQENLAEHLVRLQGEGVEMDQYYISNSLSTNVEMAPAMMAGHMLLIRLEQGDIQRVLGLLRALTPLQRERTTYYSISSMLAHYVGPTFHKVNDIRIIDQLLSSETYIDIILSFFVPVTELGGGYGLHIDRLLEKSSNKEHQAFGRSLKATHLLLTGDHNGARAEVSNIDLTQTYFPILQGRIDVLNYLLNAESKPINQALVPIKNQELFYFKAILPILVFKRRKDCLQDVFHQWNFEEFEYNHWLEECVYKQVKLCKGWLHAMNGELTESKAIIEMLEDDLWPKDYEGISLRVMAETRKLW